MTKGIFITGTDTGVGKTLATLGIMQALQQRGHTVLGMKPVASGAEPTPDGLRNSDALRLQGQGSSPVPYAWINPVTFEPAVAPHIAAAQAGRCISIPELVAQYRELSQHADYVIVEGIGGWRVPLDRTATTADLAAALAIPVVLVVGLRLGCLNHALLTVESIHGHGMHLLGWIANQPDPGFPFAGENIHCLRERITAPLVGQLPHLDRDMAIAPQGRFFDVSALEIPP